MPTPEPFVQNIKIYIYYIYDLQSTVKKSLIIIMGQDSLVVLGRLRTSLKVWI